MHSSVHTPLITRINRAPAIVRPRELPPLAGADVGKRDSAGKYPVTLKNEKYRVVLLAGATPDFARGLRKGLAEWGLHAKYHWGVEEKDWNRKVVPQDVDFVIILKDAIHHEQEASCIAASKKAGIRWGRGRRTMSQLKVMLHNHGIHKAEALNDSVMIFREDLPEAKVATPDFPERLPRSTADLHALLAKELPEERAPEEPVPEEPVPTPPSPSGLELVLPTDPTPELRQIIALATSPLVDPPLRRKLPSPRLAAVAAALMQMCADEEVTVLITPDEMTINPVKK